MFSQGQWTYFKFFKIQKALPSGHTAVRCHPTIRIHAIRRNGSGLAEDPHSIAFMLHPSIECIGSHRPFPDRIDESTRLSATTTVLSIAPLYCAEIQPWLLVPCSSRFAQDTDYVMASSACGALPGET